jgi:hypothetical protein
MKTLNYILAGTLCLASCGNDEEEQEESVELNAFDPAAAASYTAQDREDFKEGCAYEAHNTLNDLGKPQTDAFIDDYCSCTIRHVTSRWTIDELIADEPGITAILMEDGTLEECLRIAARKSEQAAGSCADGKLCRGMTAAQVRDVVGDPTTIRSQTEWEARFVFVVDKDLLVWEWLESADTSTYCSFKYAFEDYCGLAFEEKTVDGQTTWVLKDSQDFKAEWLDPVNW